MMSRIRPNALSATLALGAALLAGCDLASNLAGQTSAILGSKTSLTDTSQLTNATPLTNASALSNASPLAGQVAMLQQVSQLSALSALSASEGLAGQASQGATGGTSAYQVASVTPSPSPSPGVWTTQNGANTVTLQLASESYDPTTGAETLTGSQTTTDPAGAVVDQAQTTYTFTRSASSVPGDFSGHDDLREVVSTSSIRPIGTYEHDRDVARTTVGTVVTDTASGSVSFTGVAGGSTTLQENVWHQADSSDYAQVGRETFTGSLPSGDTFAETTTSTDSATTFVYQANCTLDLSATQSLAFAVHASGTPDSQGTPTSIAPGSSIVVDIDGSDGMPVVSLNVSTMSLVPGTPTMQTLGLIDNASADPVADFSGTFSFNPPYWTGTATSSAGFVLPLRLDGVAQLLALKD